MWSLQRVGATVAWAGLGVFLIGADLVGNPACPFLPTRDCGMRLYSWAPDVMWAGLAITVLGAALAVARAGWAAWSALAVLVLGALAFYSGTVAPVAPACSLSGSCHQYPDPARTIA